MNKIVRTILTYIIFLLLAAALIATGKLINSKRLPPEKTYDEQLAELRADLMQAAKAGNSGQGAASSTKRTSNHRSPQTRPT